MIFAGCETNTDVTCLQVIAKKEVIAKNRGGRGVERVAKSISGEY